MTDIVGPYFEGRLRKLLTSIDNSEYENKTRYNVIRIGVNRCRAENRKGIYRSTISIECPPYCETCEADLNETILMMNSRPVIPIKVLEQKLEVRFPLRLKRTLWQRDISRKIKMLLPTYGARLRILYFETHMDRVSREYGKLRADHLTAIAGKKDDDKQPIWFSFDRDAFTLCGYLQNHAMGFFGTVEITDTVGLEQGLPKLPIDVISQEIKLTLTENAFDSQWEREILKGLKDNLLDESVGTLKIRYGEEDYRRFQIIPYKMVKK